MGLVPALGAVQRGRDRRVVPALGAVLGGRAAGRLGGAQAGGGTVGWCVRLHPVPTRGCRAVCTPGVTGAEVAL